MTDQEPLVEVPRRRVGDWRTQIIRGPKGRKTTPLAAQEKINKQLREEEGQTNDEQHSD